MDPIDSHLQETCLTSERVYDGALLKINRDTVRLPNGAESVREYTEHPGAVMVIPVLADGRYVMERQFRYPLSRVFLEFPAGKIDPGEEPLATAHRELREETGYSATSLQYLTTIHPVISYSTERIVLYVARGLTAAQQQLDDNEFLDVVLVHPDELMAQIRNGEVSDVKTIIGAFWLNQDMPSEGA
ncbi:NUDIX hydrolase [Limnobacter humi]|uniref:GDP-mannose pyrophosphatase n=1 Tax=Limnobacter humi TaxID=1778671 RepID=A0ABT1WBS5_9BURK|nr:NUDIX hydrolase [Limnobacter humi]MCQ8894964.1 NUDIX hydrolase [Limnobacter humi]